MDYTIDRNQNEIFLKINEKILKGQKSQDMKVLFKELEKESPKSVKLDFSEVTIINSSGIGKMLVFYQSLKKSGGKLEITSISHELREFFAALHLDKIFSL